MVSLAAGRGNGWCLILQFCTYTRLVVIAQQIRLISLPDHIAGNDVDDDHHQRSGIFEEVLGKQRAPKAPPPQRSPEDPIRRRWWYSSGGGPTREDRPFEGNPSGRYILGHTFSFVFRDSAIFSRSCIDRTTSTRTAVSARLLQSTRGIVS